MNEIHYEVVDCSESDLFKVLNEYGEHGWDLSHILREEGVVKTQVLNCKVIFKRPL